MESTSGHWAQYQWYSHAGDWPPVFQPHSRTLISSAHLIFTMAWKVCSLLAQRWGNVWAEENLYPIIQPSDGARIWPVEWIETLLWATLSWCIRVSGSSTFSVSCYELCLSGSDISYRRMHISSTHHNEILTCQSLADPWVHEHGLRTFQEGTTFTTSAPVLNEEIFWECFIDWKDLN